MSTVTDDSRADHDRPPPGHRHPHRAVSLRERLAGRQPIGMLFGAPYALFIALIFVYPLGLSVYMSFHRYIFTAPGVSVPRPWVGLDNYRSALADPQVRQAFLNILIFLVINVPLTMVLSLLLASAVPSALPFRAFF